MRRPINGHQLLRGGSTIAPAKTQRNRRAQAVSRSRPAALSTINPGHRSMTETRTAKKPEPSTIVADDPDDLKGMLKNIGGSRSDDWNNILANQTIRSLWLKHSDAETRHKQCTAVIAALVGISPNDEL
jgi:hypothetical protein